MNCFGHDTVGSGHAVAM